MKIKTRPDDVGTPGGNEWAEMNGWLAELREDGPEGQVDDRQSGPVDDRQAGPVDDRQAGPVDDRQAGPVVRRQSGPVDDRRGGPAVGRQAGPVDDRQAGPAVGRQAGPVVGRQAGPVVGRQAGPAVGRRGAPVDGRQGVRVGNSPARPASDHRARPARRGYAAPPAGAPVRALIGDELRIPIMWCEMGSCISWYADRTALGQADVRARAIRAGWRIDALGRLACPQCQQTDVAFRATRPVVLWDRSTAIAMAARATTPDSRSARATAPDSRSARAAAPDSRSARAAAPGSWADRTTAGPSRRPAVPAAGAYGRNPRPSAAGPR